MPEKDPLVAAASQWIEATKPKAKPAPKPKETPSQEFLRRIPKRNPNAPVAKSQDEIDAERRSRRLAVRSEDLEDLVGSGVGMIRRKLGSLAAVPNFDQLAEGFILDRGAQGRQLGEITSEFETLLQRATQKDAEAARRLSVAAARGSQMQYMRIADERKNLSALGLPDSARRSQMGEFVLPGQAQEAAASKVPSVLDSMPVAGPRAKSSRRSRSFIGGNAPTAVDRKIVQGRDEFGVMTPEAIMAEYDERMFGRQLRGDNRLIDQGSSKGIEAVNAREAYREKVMEDYARKRRIIEDRANFQGVPTADQTRWTDIDEELDRRGLSEHLDSSFSSTLFRRQVEDAGGDVDKILNMPWWAKVASNINTAISPSRVLRALTGDDRGAIRQSESDKVISDIFDFAAQIVPAVLTAGLSANLSAGAKFGAIAAQSAIMDVPGLVDMSYQAGGIIPAAQGVLESIVKGASMDASPSERVQAILSAYMLFGVYHGVRSGVKGEHPIQHLIKARRGETALDSLVKSADGAPVDEVAKAPFEELDRELASTVGKTWNKAAKDFKPKIENEISKYTPEERSAYDDFVTRLRVSTAEAMPGADPTTIEDQAAFAGVLGIRAARRQLADGGMPIDEFLGTNFAVRDVDAEIASANQQFAAPEYQVADGTPDVSERIAAMDTEAARAALTNSKGVVVVPDLRNTVLSAPTELLAAQLGVHDALGIQDGVKRQQIESELVNREARIRRGEEQAPTEDGIRTQMHRILDEIDTKVATRTPSMEKPAAAPPEKIVAPDGAITALEDDNSVVAMLQNPRKVVQSKRKRSEVVKDLRPAKREVPAEENVAAPVTSVRTLGPNEARVRKVVASQRKRSEVVKDLRPAKRETPVAEPVAAPAAPELTTTTAEPKPEPRIFSNKFKGPTAREIAISDWQTLDRAIAGGMTGDEGRLGNSSFRRILNDDGTPTGWHLATTPFNKGGGKLIHHSRRVVRDILNGQVENAVAWAKKTPDGTTPNPDNVTAPPPTQSSRKPGPNEARVRKVVASQRKRSEVVKDLRPAKRETSVAEPVAAPAAPARRKEPWEMTREEWTRNAKREGAAVESMAAFHERHVVKAVAQGKPVPESIRMRVPDLEARVANFKKLLESSVSGNPAKELSEKSEQEAKRKAAEYKAARESISKPVYEFTRDEWAEPGSKGVQTKRAEHSNAVLAALKEGKSIPEEVLEDYPDLVKRYGKVEPAPAPRKVGPNEARVRKVIESQRKRSEIVKGRPERKAAAGETRPEAPEGFVGVRGYVRSDGKEIRGHIRNEPGEATPAGEEPQSARVEPRPEPTSKAPKTDLPPKKSEPAPRVEKPWWKDDRRGTYKKPASESSPEELFSLLSSDALRETQIKQRAWANRSGAEMARAFRDSLPSEIGSRLADAKKGEFQDMGLTGEQLGAHYRKLADEVLKPIYEEAAQKGQRVHPDALKAFPDIAEKYGLDTSGGRDAWWHKATTEAPETPAQKEPWQTKKDDFIREHTTELFNSGYTISPKIATFDGKTGKSALRAAGTQFGTWGDAGTIGFRTHPVEGYALEAFRGARSDKVMQFLENAYKEATRENAVVHENGGWRYNGYSGNFVKWLGISDEQPTVSVPRLATSTKPTPQQLDDIAAKTHRQAVASALAEGKLVPQEVLKDYPDLVAKQGAVRKSEADVPADQKELWQMTNVEYARHELRRMGREGMASEIKGFQKSFEAQHRVEINAAKRRGETIPPEVLAEYPEDSSPAPTQATEPKPEPAANASKEPWALTRREYSSGKKDLIDAEKALERAHEANRRARADGGVPSRAKSTTLTANLDNAAEYRNDIRAGYYKEHRQSVEQALIEGKQVPDEVLNDYPDLARKYSNKASEPAPEPVAAPVASTKAPEYPWDPGYREAVRDADRAAVKGYTAKKIGVASRPYVIVDNATGEPSALLGSKSFNTPAEAHHALTKAIEAKLIDKALDNGVEIPAEWQAKSVVRSRMYAKGMDVGVYSQKPAAFHSQQPGAIFATIMPERGVAQVYVKVGPSKSIEVLSPTERNVGSVAKNAPATMVDFVDPKTIGTPKALEQTRVRVTTTQSIAGGKTTPEAVAKSRDTRLTEINAAIRDLKSLPVSKRSPDRDLAVKLLEGARDSIKAWKLVGEPTAPTKSEPTAAQKEAPTGADVVTALKAGTDYKDATAMGAIRILQTRINDGDITPDEIRAQWEEFKSDTHQAKLKAELSAMTKDQLWDIVGGLRRNDYKKDQLVKRAAEDVASVFRFTEDGSYTISWNESNTESVEKTLSRWTEESIKAHSARVKATREERAAKARERNEKLANPQTHEDYETLIYQNGRDALVKSNAKLPRSDYEKRSLAYREGLKTLTDKQRVEWERLIALKNREQSEINLARRVTVDAVAVPESAKSSMEIVETTHSKKGHTVYVVKMGERVEKEAYNALNARAKTLGGYYSSFRGQGAVPGFQFKDLAAAEAFMKVDERVDGAEIVAAKNEVKREGRAARLLDSADSLEAKASESLSKERKTNTHKRAGEAFAMEEQARADIAMAKTMRNLAAAIESGEAKMLDRVHARTHVEALESLARHAKNQWVSEEAKGKSYQEREALKNTPITEDMIQKLAYPWPAMHAGNLSDAIRKLGAGTGTKRLAARLAKIQQNLLRLPEGFGYLTSHESAETLVEAGKATGEKYWTTDTYQTVRRIGLDTPAELRTAVREYIKYRGDAPKSDPLKAAKRELIGTKIDGFFPTPKTLADDMVQRLGIEPGMSVLEPSAGKGDLIEAVKRTQPDVKITAAETSSKLREILTLKGIEPGPTNILEHNPGEVYDRIIMNPPFEGGQDMDHVRHAYGLLKPGGKMVAIMSEGPFFRGDKKATEFRNWMESVGGTSEKNPDGSFNTNEAFRTTGVTTRMVEIEKPAGVAAQADPAPKTAGSITLSPEGAISLTTRDGAAVVALPRKLSDSEAQWMLENLRNYGTSYEVVGIHKPTGARVLLGWTGKNSQSGVEEVAMKSGVELARLGFFSGDGVITGKSTLLQKGQAIGDEFEFGLSGRTEREVLSTRVMHPRASDFKPVEGDQAPDAAIQAAELAQGQAALRRADPRTRQLIQVAITAAENGEPILPTLYSFGAKEGEARGAMQLAKIQKPEAFKSVVTQSDQARADGEMERMFGTAGQTDEQQGLFQRKQSPFADSERESQMLTIARRAVDGGFDVREQLKLFGASARESAWVSKRLEADVPDALFAEGGPKPVELAGPATRNEEGQSTLFQMYPTDPTPYVLKGVNGNTAAGYYRADDDTVVFVKHAADFSTVVHELYHSWFERMPDWVQAEMLETMGFPGYESLSQLKSENGPRYTLAQETFARAGERYLLDGKAPTPDLQELFSAAKVWMKEVYDDVAQSTKSSEDPRSVKMDDRLRSVFDRMTLSKDDTLAAARVSMAMQVSDQAVEVEPTVEPTTERLQSLKDADSGAILSGPATAQDIHGNNFWEVRMPVSDLGIKQGLQFRTNVEDGSTGTTNDYKGVRFDPIQSGVFTAWMDNAGKVYVLNGHHRRRMAIESGTDPVLTVRVLKESEGMTLDMARIHGALTNVRDGNAQPIEIAMVMRQSNLGRKELADMGVGLKKNAVRNGYMLSTLPNDALDLVLNGAIDQNVAAGVGAALEGSPEPLYMAALQSIVRNPRSTLKTYDDGFGYGMEARARGMGEKVGASDQMGFADLLGEEELSQWATGIEESAALKKAVQSEIRKRKAAFGALLRGQEVGGTKVDKDAQSEAADFERFILEITEQNGTDFARAVTSEGNKLAQNWTDKTFKAAIDRLMEVAKEDAGRWKKYGQRPKQGSAPDTRASTERVPVGNEPATGAGRPADPGTPEGAPQAQVDESSAGYQNLLTLARAAIGFGGDWKEMVRAAEGNDAEIAAIQAQLDRDAPSLFQAKRKADDRDLAVYHNTSIDGLRAALDQGGIPNPSLAITRKDSSFNQFGRVTLVGTKDLADPRSSGVNVFDGDAYSPRQPRPAYRFDRKKIADAIRAVLPEREMTGFIKRSDEFWSEGYPRLESKKPFENNFEHLVSAVSGGDWMMAAYAERFPQNVNTRNDGKPDVSVRHLQHYNGWVAEVLRPAIGGLKPLINVGGKWVEYDLGVASRKMNAAGMRNAEKTMTYGTANALAENLKKFSTLDAVRGDKGRLVTDGKMEAVADRIEQLQYRYEREALRNVDPAKTTNSWEPYDAAMKAVSAVMKGAITSERMAQALRAKGLDSSDKAVRMGVELANALKAAKRPYFESKLTRPVKLNEFVAALVPSDTPKDLQLRLKEAGLKVFQYEDSDNRFVNENRLAKLQEIHQATDVLFQTKPERKPLRPEDARRLITDDRDWKAKVRDMVTGDDSGFKGIKSAIESGLGFFGNIHDNLRLHGEEGRDLSARLVSTLQTAESMTARDLREFKRLIHDIYGMTPGLSKDFRTMKNELGPKIDKGIELTDPREIRLHEFLTDLARRKREESDQVGDNVLRTVRFTPDDVPEGKRVSPIPSALVGSDAWILNPDFDPYSDTGAQQRLKVMIVGIKRNLVVAKNPQTGFTYKLGPGEKIWTRSVIEDDRFFPRTLDMDKVAKVLVQPSYEMNRLLDETVKAGKFASREDALESLRTMLESGVDTPATRQVAKFERILKVLDFLVSTKQAANIAEANKIIYADYGNPVAMVGPESPLSKLNRERRGLRLPDEFYDTDFVTQVSNHIMTTSTRLAWARWFGHEMEVAGPLFEALARKAGPHGPKEVQALIDGMQMVMGITKPETKSYETMRAIARAEGSLTLLTKLTGGTTGIVQLGQLASSYGIFGGKATTRAAFELAKDIPAIAKSIMNGYSEGGLRGMVRKARIGPAAEKAMLSGAIEHDFLQTLGLEDLQEAKVTRILSLIGDKAAMVTGIKPIDSALRIHGAISGKFAAMDAIKRIELVPEVGEESIWNPERYENTPGPSRKSNRMVPKNNAAYRLLRDWFEYTNDDIVQMVTTQRMTTAQEGKAYFGGSKAQGKVGKADMPTWVTAIPGMRMATRLQTFNYAMAKVFYHTIKELAKGNPAPIVRMATGGVLMGGVVNLLIREVIGALEQNDPEATVPRLSEGVDAAQEGDFTKLAERLYADLLKSGVMGLIGTPLEINRRFEMYSSAIERPPSDVIEMQLTPPSIKTALNVFDVNARVNADTERANAKYLDRMAKWEEAGGQLSGQPMPEPPKEAAPWVRKLDQFARREVVLYGRWRNREEPTFYKAWTRNLSRASILLIDGLGVKPRVDQGPTETTAEFSRRLRVGGMEVNRRVEDIIKNGRIRGRNRMEIEASLESEGLLKGMGPNQRQAEIDKALREARLKVSQMIREEMKKQLPEEQQKPAKKSPLFPSPADKIRRQLRESIGGGESQEAKFRRRVREMIR